MCVWGGGRGNGILRLHGFMQVILEVIMIMQSGRGSDPHLATFHKRYSRSIHRPLLDNAPSTFAEAVIGLAAELIAVTSSVPDRAQGKLRYVDLS